MKCIILVYYGERLCYFMLDSLSKKILDYLNPIARKNPRVNIDLKQLTSSTQFKDYSQETIENQLTYLEECGYLNLAKAMGFTKILKVNPPGIYYEEFEDDEAQQVVSQIFNITNATGAAFGNSNSSITVNNGVSIEEIKEFIENNPAYTNEEKSTANEIVNLVEEMTNSEAPVPKGFLEKFTNFLDEHDDLTTLIVESITNLIMGFFTR
jgi:hypothetical protein